MHTDTLSLKNFCPGVDCVEDSEQVTAVFFFLCLLMRIILHAFIKISVVVLLDHNYTLASES